MEQKILELFLFNNKLKFSEIEKALKTRSNKLTYHLKKLENKKILIKEKEFYKISSTAEYLIPYLSNKKHVLAVILIHIGNNKKSFLPKRKKRPFKNKLGVPSGRIILGENFNDSVKRIMKEKFNINAKLKKINSISLEHVKKDNKIVHSFLHVFITATTKDKINYIDIESNKDKIISSDYKLIKNDLNKEIKIKTFFTST